jgi:hypothetical protein
MQGSTYEQQLAGIREQFRNDVGESKILNHFETLVNYIDCCRSESPEWACEEIRATIRFIMARCHTVRRGTTRLGGLLLWVLRCRYPYLVDVWSYQSELAGEKWQEAKILRDKGLSEQIL